MLRDIVYAIAAAATALFRYGLITLPLHQYAVELLPLRLPPARHAIRDKRC